MILESAVGRPSGCVPRGVWQGITRRNSWSIATSYNAVRRRAERALEVVATLTHRMNPIAAHYLLKSKYLPGSSSGQLGILG